LLLFILVVTENETAATISLFIFGLLVHFFTKVNVITFIRENAGYIAELGAIYIGVGLAWSLAKWFFFVRDIREQYLAFLEEKKAGKKANWFHTDVPPKASRHKGEIISWIGYWPISIVWTLFDDFLTKVFRHVYDLFAGTFQRISNAQFKGIPVERD